MFEKPLPLEASLPVGEADPKIKYTVWKRVGSAEVKGKAGHGERTCWGSGMTYKGDISVGPLSEG